MHKKKDSPSKNQQTFKSSHLTSDLLNFRDLKLFQKKQKTEIEKSYRKLLAKDVSNTYLLDEMYPINYQIPADGNPPRTRLGTLQLSQQLAQGRLKQQLEPQPMDQIRQTIPEKQKNTSQKHNHKCHWRSSRSKARIKAKEIRVRHSKQNAARNW